MLRQNAVSHPKYVNLLNPVRLCAEYLLCGVAPNVSDELRAKRTLTRYPSCFDETRSIFVHIPKTAGMSIASALYGQQVAHADWRHWKNVNPRKFKAYFKFAVIRDPFSRFNSAFQFLKAGGVERQDQEFAELALQNYSKVNDLAEALADANVARTVIPWIHFRPQASYVVDQDGHSMVDKLIPFEDLARCFDTIRKRVKHDALLLRLNTGPRSNVTGAFGTNAAAILRRIYDLDFQLWEQARSKADQVISDDGCGSDARIFV